MGKGSARRKGSDDRKYTDNYTKIKGFKSNMQFQNFEEAFMTKEASQQSSKYFTGELNENTDQV